MASHTINRVAIYARISTTNHGQDMRRKIEALAQVVEADRAWIACQNQLEAELEKVRDYYAQEHAKEEAAADRARRGKSLRLGKEIYRDAATAERKLLLARGVYRGR